jgi:hypothetical protein
MQRPGQSVSVSGTYAIVAICLILFGLLVGRPIAAMFWSILRDFSGVAH